VAAFEYTALDDAGRRRHGVVEGDSPRHARERLRAQGYVPMALAPAGGRRGAESRASRRALPAAALARVTRQLATLLGAGMPVADALRVVARVQPRTHAQGILLEVRAAVLGGEPLHRAMAAVRVSASFSPFVRAVVAAGEESGQLAQVMQHLADYTENRHAAQQRLRLALLYPALLLVVSVLVVGVLVAYVVPQVTLVFEASGASLPWLTRALLWLSGALRTWGWFLVLAMIAGGILGRMLLRQRALRARRDRWLLRGRGIAGATQTVLGARFAHTLALLVGSGVPLTRALAAAREVTQNLELRAAMETVEARIGGGESLHAALADTGAFPAVLHELVGSGEASGALADMLARAASALEQDADRWIRTAVGLVEPGMILLMGGVVLLVVLAILTPIFELNVLVQ
jgi:general secretion pathway protein F